MEVFLDMSPHIQNLNIAHLDILAEQEKRAGH